MSEYLGVKDMVELLGVSRPTFWRYRKEGKVPAPIKSLSSRKRPLWHRETIDQWIKEEGITVFKNIY